MKKLLYNLAWFGIISAAIIISVVTFWLIYPYNVLTFQKGNGIIINKVVKPGEKIMMIQNNCKKINTPSTINRQFIDGVIYQVPTSVNNRPVGCSARVELIDVPETLQPGKYSIRTVISFNVNPLRTVSYTVETEHFEIVKP